MFRVPTFSRSARLCCLEHCNQLFAAWGHGFGRNDWKTVPQRKKRSTSSWFTEATLGLPKRHWVYQSDTGTGRLVHQECSSQPICPPPSNLSRDVWRICVGWHTAVMPTCAIRIRIHTQPLQTLKQTPSFVSMIEQCALESIDLETSLQIISCFHSKVVFLNWMGKTSI
jgi:hypothetical protein